MPIHGYPGGVITANPVAPTASVATGVWTTEQQLQAVSQGNWPGYEYPIFRSLRFNSADSAYLNRTPASAGNLRTWTWSGWVKRSSLSQQVLFSARVGTSLSRDAIRFDSDNTLQFDIYDLSLANLKTTAVYRDISAWYHVVVALDTTQATSTNRMKMYVNGVQVTSFGTANYPTQNLDGNINTAQPHGIGVHIANPQQYYNGYMTEINFIDGQQLDPTSFGLNDPETGVWSPKRYTGTYGTNGFYLNFSDNSGTTSTTLGKDYSGNGNNWTPNNFSVTAGAGNDSLVDTPTAYGTDTGVGGEVRGNYATLNPLAPPVWAGTNYALSNGNLAVTFGYQTAPSTFSVSSGKWYWEVNCTTNNGSGSNNTRIGIVPNPYGTGTPGDMTGSYAYTATGQKGASNVYTTYGASFTDGDIIGVALDLDNGTIAFYKNGSSQGTAFTGISGSFYAMSGSGSSSGTVQSYNFGQRAFAYTAPSGFKALCTQNLPTPTIGATSTTQANDYFDVSLWTGNGTSQTITNSGSMQPDFVWYKRRSTAAQNGLMDSVRGATKYLASDTTDAESTVNGVTSFNANGFTVGDAAGANSSGGTFVGWQWRASNTTAVTNTAGTITSTVSANTTSGFSIVTYTGNGSANQTVGHGLGISPSLVIFKSRNTVVDWPVYSSVLGVDKYLALEQTAAAGTATGYYSGMSSSVIGLGYGAAAINGNTRTFVAYCFAPVAGYSAFGSYTGNGSTDGPFVYTGMRPAFILWKRSDGAESWWINDTDRLGYNGDNRALFPNLSNAENTANNLDILSNGFKIRGSGGEVNASGGTYIYACFAENPFKYSLAR